MWLSVSARERHVSLCNLHETAQAFDAKQLELQLPGLHFIFPARICSPVKDGMPGPDSQSSHLLSVHLTSRCHLENPLKRMWAAVCVTVHGISSKSNPIFILVLGQLGFCDKVRLLAG